MKLLSMILLVTVFKCYGQHSPVRDRVPRARGQDESSLVQSITRSISNDFNWSVGGQLRQSQKSSESDVIVMIVEYKSSDYNREPSPSYYGRELPHYGHHQPPPPPHGGPPPPPPPHSGPPHQPPHGSAPNPPPLAPYDINNAYYKSDHAQIHNDQYDNEAPRHPTRPLIGYSNSENSNYDIQYFEILNSDNNSGYDHSGLGAQTSGRPWEHQGNNEDYAAYNKFYENKPTGQTSVNYNTPGLGNQNPFIHMNQWDPGNFNQGIESGKQHPNNGEFISGMNNPINNPSGEVPQFSAKPSPPSYNGETITKETLNPVGKMESDNKTTDEDEDFQIDVRFKAD